MTTAAVPVEVKPPNLLRPILVGGFIAGTLARISHGG
jgi:hypothetical protein